MVLRSKVSIEGTPWLIIRCDEMFNAFQRSTEKIVNDNTCMFFEELLYGIVFS